MPHHRRLKSPMPDEFHILLVEDSRADVKIIERALREGKVEHRLTVIPDGRRAIDYLIQLQEPDAAEHLQPDLILLDLNLPGIDGCQVLTQIKNDAFLRAIPVVVLTTSRRGGRHPVLPGRHQYLHPEAFGISRLSRPGLDPPAATGVILPSSHPEPTPDLTHPLCRVVRRVVMPASRSPEHPRVLARRHRRRTQGRERAR